MIPALYVLACAIFYVAFVKLQVVGRTLALLAVFRSAALVMADRGLSDLEKEAHVRRAAVRSLAETLALAVRLMALVACAGLPVLLATQVGGVGLGQFAAFSLDPLVLLCTVLALLAVDRARKAFGAVG